MIAALTGLSLFVVPFEGPKVRVEIDPAKNLYRAVIQTTRPLSFNAWVLGKPSGSLSPGVFSIEVLDRAGQPLPCPGADGSAHDGRYRSSSISSNLIRVPRNPPKIRVRSEFATDWYESRALFSGFRHCKNARDPATWGTYRIHVAIETSVGVLTTRSEWMDVPQGGE